MTKEEIKNALLRRLYSGAFEEGVNFYFPLDQFADSINVDRGQIWKIFDELESDGLVECKLSGGNVEPTTRGLLYCEENGLISSDMVHKQMMIRTKLVVTLYEMEEQAPYGHLIFWEEWLEKAGVSQQDFKNNEKLMKEIGLIANRDTFHFCVAPFGAEKAKEYKSKVKQVEDFSKLDKLQGMTEQQRGHKFEDFLGEVIKGEGWEVDVRVRAQGQENDIVIHKGLDYFLISCKWETPPIEPAELDVMYSRASGRRDIKGAIIVSMSGFTDSCVNQAIRKMENCHIILFGEKDIYAIISFDKTFTTLLDEKYKEAMLHGRLLLDGEIRDVKPT